MRHLLFHFSILLCLSFFSCIDQESCEFLGCVNDGICMDGTCICPDGYSGISCELLSEPVSINLKKIKLISFVPFDSTFVYVDGDSQCVNGLKMRIVEGTKMLYESNTLDTACSQDNHKFEITNDISFLTNREYTFELIDIDDGGELIMSSFPYKIRRIGDPHREIIRPTTYTQLISSTYEIEVSYTF